MVENSQSTKEEIKVLLESRGRRDKSGTESKAISNDVAIQAIIPNAYYLMEGGFSDNPNTFHDANIGTWNPATRTATLTTNIDNTIQILIDDVTLTAAIDPNTNTRYKISVLVGYGIYIDSSPETRKNITITNMDIFPSEVGIYAANTANLIIQENSIHGIYDIGINLLHDNKSAIIQKNSIHNCGEEGIEFGYDNESNTILCNLIKENTEVGFAIVENKNSNNLIKRNNFIKNHPNAVNSGNNTFSGNYWSDWDGNGPYIFSGGVDNNPSRFPVSCTIFKQFSVQGFCSGMVRYSCTENCLKSV